MAIVDLSKTNSGGLGRALGPSTASRHAEAARKAFAIYRSRDQNRKLDLVPALVAEAMESSDPEFLVEFGEQLAIGQVIERDFKLAEACFRRAMHFSRVMGGYALGRLFFYTDPPLAKTYFEVATKEGHVASVVCEVYLTTRSRPLLRRLLSVRIFFAAAKAYWLLERNMGSAKLRFWRYRDAYMPLKAVENKIGGDRNIYFPWTRPTGVDVFRALCLKAR